MIGRTYRLLLGVLGLLLAAGAAQASDGRIEVSQPAIEDAGGFPHVLSAPGSYLLTGPITVPADTDGFVVQADAVVFDLNGFTVSGPASCQAGGCPSGLGSAFVVADAARQTTIRNGQIRGFGGDCVRLGPAARLDELAVSECGQNGVAVDPGGVLTHLRVSRTARSGLALTPGEPRTVYAFSSVSQAGLGGGGFTAVSAGKGATGNACDDGSCGWADDRRSFYLTATTHDGLGATAACDAGYHMASLWEVMDPTDLRYDASRGPTNWDTGQGPPAVVSGWIRTGREPPIIRPYAGEVNCRGWSVNGDVYLGTLMQLVSWWTLGDETSQEYRIPGWRSGVDSCDELHRVWCVQN